jgi:hypothetical protein
MAMFGQGLHAMGRVEIFAESPGAGQDRDPQWADLTARDHDAPLTPRPLIDEDPLLLQKPHRRPNRLVVDPELPGQMMDAG